MGNDQSPEHPPPLPPRPKYFSTGPVRRNPDFYSELCQALQAQGEKIDSAQPMDTSEHKKKKCNTNLTMPAKFKIKNRKKLSESVFLDDAPNNAELKPEEKVPPKPPPRRRTGHNFEPDEGRRRPDDHNSVVVPDPEIVPDTLADDDVPEPVEKRYDPLDMTLKFVTRQDEIDPFSSEDGDSSLRAEMSCGHAVTPESLTDWCRSLLEQGKFKFRCPAVVEGTKLCNKVWTYQEVRRLADLSVEEMEYFESTVARLAASQYCDIKPCPKCRTSVERVDISNLCVCCTICTADLGKVYQFCWLCLREWTGPGLQPDRCNNDGCFNKDLQLLQTCESISLPEVKGVTDCPSVRACPTCGIIVQHSRDYCKNIYCPRCHVKFCFVCLKLKAQM